MVHLFYIHYSASLPWTVRQTSIISGSFTT